MAAMTGTTGSGRSAGSGRRRVTALLAGGALAVVAAGAVLRERWQASAAAAVVADLHNIDNLRARFNADAGAPRLILLLSPT